MDVYLAHIKPEPLQNNTPAATPSNNTPAATPQGTPRSQGKKARLSAACEIVQESLAKLKNEIDRTN